MNPSEIKIQVRCRDKEWRAGASGLITLGQVREMAQIELNCPTVNTTPRLLLQHQGRGWKFPDHYTLDRLVGFTHEYNLEFELTT